MKEAIIPLGNFLKKGLGPNHNKRNEPFLTKSVGAFVYEGVLQAIENFSNLQINLVSAYLPATYSFPYPQMFVLSDVIVFAFESAIFEAEGTAIVPGDVNVNLMLDGLPAENPWTFLDFRAYIYMSNGAVTVTKDPNTGLYSVDTTGLPIALAACDFNGQVILGGITKF